MSGTGIFSPPMQYKYLQVIFGVAFLVLLAAPGYNEQFSYPVILNFISFYHIMAFACLLGFIMVYKRFRV